MKTKARILTLILMLAMLVSIISIVSISTFAAETEEWVKTDIADIEKDDVVVIVWTKSGGSYAVTNSNGTGSAPGAYKVTISNDTLSGNIPENVRWNISYNSGKLTIYPNGDTSKWLYCTATNNGVRVGTNANKEFTIDSDSGYLKNTATGRFLGVYNSQDLRCYTSSTATNIKSQTLSFYVLKTSSGGGHTHSYTEKVTTAATCITEGVLTKTCTVDGCDNPVVQEKIAATGIHNYVDGTCSVCGEKQPTGGTVTLAYPKCDTTTNMTGNNDAAKLGLDASIFSVIGNKGGTSYNCGLNKDGNIRLYGSSSNGNGSYFTVTVGEGYIIKSITVTFVNTTNNKNCQLIVGETKTTFNGSSTTWSEDVNSDSFTLKNVITGATTQIYIASIDITYEKLHVHEWQDADCDTPKTCKTCGVTEGEPNGHKWGDWEVDVPATEEAEGTQYRECANCDARETETIPTLSHQHSYTSATTAPTCTADGYTTYTCSTCGDTYTEAGESATGHTEETVAGKDATCTETGLTDGKICTVCGVTTVEQEEIPATGHDYNDGVVTTAPTCTEAGVKTYTCENDPSHTKTEVIPATGHTYENHKCSVCGAKEPDEVTVITVISDYANSNNWSNEKQYTSLKMDDYINVSVSGGGNTGKYYTNGINWRLYQSEDATLKITAAEGKTIVSVKITYTNSSNGILMQGSTQISSGTIFDVNANSITFSVGNTGTATNGQVRITEIEVVYSVPHTCKFDKQDTTIEGALKSAATCTSPAVYYMSCSCGDLGTETFESGKALDHTGGTPEEENRVEATCGDDGSYDLVVRCTECSAVISRESKTISATGNHAYDNACDAECNVCHKEREASDHVYDNACDTTCNECGFTRTITHTYDNACDTTCNVCGAERTITHSYESSVTPPTCTTAGYTTYTCACGDTYTADEVAATGHTENAVVTSPDCENGGYTTYTCTVCGATRTGNETTALGHTPGAEADCENAQTCTVCGDTLVEATGHSYESSVTEPTCTEAGYTTYTCSVCDHSYTEEGEPATGHVNTTTNTVDATCTTAGSITVTCSCGHVVSTETIPATGHAWGDWNEDTPATEETEGTKHRECANCDATENGIIPTLGHEHSYNAVVTDPTCTEQGYTTHTCRCNDSYIDSYVDALGHQHTTTTTVNATCTVDGSETVTCDDCHATISTTTIPATGHSYNAVVTAPTFEAKGYTTYTCACGDSYVDDYVDALVAVAIIGEQKYTTLQEAFNAAVDGDTITLLADIKLSKYLDIFTENDGEIARSLTLNLNGHSITPADDYKVTDYSLVFVGINQTLTIVGEGTISAHAGVTLGVYGTLNLTSGTVVNTGTAEKDGALCVWYWNHDDDGYDGIVGGTCYVTGGQIEGAVYVDEPDEDGKATLVIRGGQFTADVNEWLENGYHLVDGSVAGHFYESSVTAPTCTEAGYTTYTCACGDTYTADEVAATEHSFTSYVSNNDATCTADGTKTAKCDRCDATDTVTDEGSKLGHSFANYVSDENATCTADGTKTAKCDRCEATDTVTDEGSKLDHADEDPRDHECDVCGLWLSDCVDENKNHKCDICNDVMSKCADNDKDHKCDYCGAQNSHCIDIPPYDHKCDWCGEKMSDCVAGTPVVENKVGATCTTDGSYDEVTYCTVCGEEISRETTTIPATGHVNTTTNTVNATCTADGSTTVTCDDCHATVSTETIEATGHVNKTTTTVNATCTTAGSITVTCDDCGATVSTTTIPASHNIKHANAQASTCTVKGWNAYDYCTKCDYSTKVLLPLAGHTEITVAGKAATCTQTGLTDGKKCSVCGVTTKAQTTIPATGHVNTTTTTTPATCTAAGSTVVKCNCGVTVSTTVIPATGHVNTSENVTKAPTCTEVGSKAIVCDACSVTVDTAEIPALGHDIVIDEAVDATCTETGLTAGSHCSRCDDVTLTQEEVAATGHKWVDATCETPKTCSKCGETEGEPLEHTYDSIFDKACNACGAIREGETQDGVEETGNMWTRIMDTIANFFKTFFDLILSLFR